MEEKQMLVLKNVKKNYYVGEQTVEALKGIDLSFRKNEFVSILGPSGCGKTTTLNIIGGLDRYTSGDLLIDNKSTKNFKDQDWDAYRNSTIGFVFQNYNLISHLSVLDNVEMALTLSGVSPSERKAKATKVLEEVGLKDQIHKKPNQLSGGQMQRVAIARALVNDPKILLADEPTGALDSKTSKQIMKLIKEISNDRLVIMVTHNNKIASTYSDRIIRLLDGEVIEDTNGHSNGELQDTKTLSNKKTSMSYYQAIRTSFKNLFTKKGRTLVTAFAGSIGIIGVAIVLGLSAGMTSYVSEVESDSLAGVPIVVNQTVVTNSFGPAGDAAEQLQVGDFPDGNVVYSFDRVAETITHKNILDETFISYVENMDEDLYTSISYTSAIAINMVKQNQNGSYGLINKTVSGGETPFGSTDTYNQLPSNPEFVQSQYDLLAGTYPMNANEAVLVVDTNNQFTVELLEELGFNIEDEYTFEDFIGTEYKVVPNHVFYQEMGAVYLPSNDYEAMYNHEDSSTLEIVGIMRVNQDATTEILTEGIWYTPALTEELQMIYKDSDIVQAQIASPETSVLTGQPFNDILTYDYTMQLLGENTSPVSVQIFPASYEAKDEIKAYLDEYNIDKTEEYKIVYTDIAEVISSSIGTLINTITIVLTALAAVSLVVSSIMIGIITYVSVVERTKEIGIMRSLGARKKDISRIFNAEALLIGLTSGILGIGIYYILQGPINVLIGNFIDVEQLASLPIYYAVGLIVLSSGLTLLAGLIPSSIAAKKDPVIALRTE
jgi:putative ABC transport system permease protein